MSANDPIADVGDWLQSALMPSVAIRVTAALLAILSLLPTTFFTWIAWGQWNCGIMGLQVALANLVAAIGLSTSMIIWRHSTPTDQRFGPTFIFSPWILLGALTLLLVTFAPTCPFLSR